MRIRFDIVFLSHTLTEDTEYEIPIEKRSGFGPEEENDDEKQEDIGGE